MFSNEWEIRRLLDYKLQYETWGELLSTDSSPAASDSDSELEELLRDTPEPSTHPVQSPTPGPPLTPGAARITQEASQETTGDLEAVVDELQVWGEEQLLG